MSSRNISVVSRQSKCLFALLGLFCISVSFNAQAAFSASTDGKAVTGEQNKPVSVAKETVGKLCEGFTLKAELVCPVSGLSDPIMLKLSLKNSFAGESQVFVSNGEPYYEVNIVDSSGKKIPEIDLGPYSCTIATMMSVKLGEVLDDKLHIAKEHEVSPQGKYYMERKYELSNPGVYYITASRSVPRIDKTGYENVISNTVKLEIIGDDTSGCDPNPIPMAAVKSTLEKSGFMVVWDGKEEKASISNPGRSVIQANSDILTMNGNGLKMKKAAYVLNGELYAPVEDLETLKRTFGKQ